MIMNSASDPSNLPKQHHRTSCTDITQCDCANCTPSPIPSVYRVWHLYLEPVIALGGTYHLHFAPAQYFAYMPRTCVYVPATQLVYDQLASAYLCFGMAEALVLRRTSDVKVWQALLLALLLCDIGHSYAAWLEMGRAFWRPWLWEGMDATTMAMNLVPLVLRVGFLCGIGFADGHEAESM